MKMVLGLALVALSLNACGSKSSKTTPSRGGNASDSVVTPSNTSGNTTTSTTGGTADGIPSTTTSPTPAPTPTPTPTPTTTDTSTTPTPTDTGSGTPSIPGMPSIPPECQNMGSDPQAILACMQAMGMGTP